MRRILTTSTLSYVSGLRFLLLHYTQNTGNLKRINSLMHVVGLFKAPGVP